MTSNGLSFASETQRSFHESVTAPEEQQEIRRPFRPAAAHHRPPPPRLPATLRSPCQFSTTNDCLPLFQHLHHPRARYPQFPRRPSWETVFGGPDWADSSKHDISLQPEMEHMVTRTQLAAPISGVLSLPAGKKNCCFFFLPPAAEWPQS